MFVSVLHYRPRAALEAAGVPVLVDNEHVGHGVDHPEIAVMYGWVEKWNDSDGNVPPWGSHGLAADGFPSLSP